MIYQREPWSDERRARLSEIHRKRWGAPDGFCTIYGIHVPFEHREPIRYWADWVAYHQGRESAQEFVHRQRASDYSAVDYLRKLMLRKRQIYHNAEAIRQVQWEAHRANQNRG